ncbi:MAG: trigger factor [Chloroflexi bacterium]|nr:trigger factor [Chloroflexota bacterium]
MKVTTEPAPDSQIVLTIEIEPAELEASLDSAYRRLAQRALVPGFRKGKAPRAILERYLGRSVIMEEALEQLAPRAVRDAIQEQKIDAISQPRLEVTQIDPVIVKATVDVRPTIDLGDYRALRVEPAPVELAPTAVEEALERLREREATWEPVERPVAADDLVTLDYRITRDEEVVGQGEGVSYRVQLERTDPLPGFAAELVGLTAGETKQFDLSFPEESEHQALAGTRFQVMVTVQEVKAKVLPPLDDSFATTVAPDLASLAALRERIEANLRARAELEAYRKTRDAALQALVAQATVETPASMVENQIDRLVRNRQEAVRRTGLRWEDYVRVVAGSEQQLREALREEARTLVRQRLVLEALADAEGIEASADEINDELAEEVRSSGLAAPQAGRLLEHPEARALARQNIRLRKAAIRLVELATAGQLSTPPTAAEPAAEVEPGASGLEEEP